MTSKTLKSILWYVLLLLAQVLVLNHIHLFQCATPLLYIYMVIGIRRNLEWSLEQLSSVQFALALGHC